MRRTIKHTARWSWLISAVAVILVAIALSALRVLAPLVADYRAAIEQEVSRNLGKTVSIGEIDLKLRGFQTQLELRDIDLYSDDGSEVLQSLKLAYITPDWINSLVSGRVRLTELVINGGQISFMRDTDGTLSLRGVQFGNDNNWLETLSDLVESQPNITLHLRDSTLEWVDRLNDIRMAFPGVDVTGSRNEEIYRLAFVANLPPDVGEFLKMVIHFYGDLDKPHEWRGRIYEKAEGIRVDSPALQEFGGYGSPEAGVISFEGWSDWNQGRIQRLVGSLRAEDLRFRAGPEATGVIASLPVIDRVAANLEWENQAQGKILRIGGLELEVDGKRWPDTQAAISYTFDDGGAWRAGAVVDYVDLNAVWPLVRRTVVAQRKDGVEPEDTMLSGDLHRVKLMLQGSRSEMTHYGLSADFRDMGISPVGRFPGFSGLDGTVRFNQAEGQLGLDTRALLIDAPQLFSKGLWVDRLGANVSWSNQDGVFVVTADHFTATNPDIHIKGRGDFIKARDESYVDVRLAYRDGNGSHVERYLPDQLLPPQVTKWLSESIKGGYITQGDLVFKGDPAQFPFDEGEGVFKATAKVQEGILKPRPHAVPISGIEADLEFKNRGLRLVGDRARWLEAQVGPASVEIADLSKPQLHLSGTARGDVNDMATIVRSLDIPGYKAGLGRKVQFNGEADLDLELQMPLSKKLAKPVSVKGTVTLDQVAVNLVDVKLQLSELNGSVNFDRSGVQARSVRGKWFGRPLTLGARVASDGSQMVTLQGRVGTDVIAQRSDSPLSKYAKGESLWKMEFNTPSISGGGVRDGLEFKLSSDLDGTAVYLPEPLGKEIGETRNFKFQGTWDEGIRGLVRLDYGSASSVMFVTKLHGKHTVPRGELALDKGQAVLPDKGWSVRGRVKDFSIDAWRAVLKTQVKAHDSAVVDPQAVNAVALHFGRFTSGGLELEDLAIKARRQGEYWRSEIDSPIIRGRAEVPTAFASGLPIKGDFQYLRIETDPNKVTESRLDPRTIPALNIRSDEFRYNERLFKRFELQTSRHQDGLQIHSLKLEGEELLIRASGDWSAYGIDNQQTTLRVAARSDDLGQALRALDVAQGLEGGKTELDMDLSWPGSPFQFGFDELKGRADLSIKQGRLTDVEAGAGRLIGLLNIGALSRRLSLDFSDVFKKGYAFDRVGGNFQIDGPVLVTRNLEMEGPAADIRVTGRTNVKTEEYDQLVTVVPEVGGGMAVAGTLLGGPIVGATVLVLDKVLAGMQRDIGKITGLKYRVTGPWDDPVIKKIGAPKSADGIEADGIEVEGTID